MRKQISIFAAINHSIDLDPDMYCKIVDYGRDFCKLDNYGDICLVNKNGIKVPIWRIVRKCWNPDLKVRYLDNNRTNLTRDNLRICLNQ